MEPCELPESGVANTCVLERLQVLWEYTLVHIYLFFSEENESFAVNMTEARVDVGWRRVWINLVSDVPSLAGMLQTPVLIRPRALLGMLMGLAIPK